MSTFRSNRDWVIFIYESPVSKAGPTRVSEAGGGEGGRREDMKGHSRWASWARLGPGD